MILRRLVRRLRLCMPRALVGPLPGPAARLGPLPLGGMVHPSLGPADLLLVLLTWSRGVTAGPGQLLLRQHLGFLGLEFLVREGP